MNEVIEPRQLLWVTVDSGLLILSVLSEYTDWFAMQSSFPQTGG